MSDLRMGPAARSQRLPREGPISLTARPNLNSGAKVKGLYDIPANSWVHLGNTSYSPPEWVGALDTHFLDWGGRFYGTGSTVDSFDQFRRGATLYGLDVDDNPVVIDQVDTASVGNDEATEVCYGGSLGERGTIGTLVGTGVLPGLIIRSLPYGPFPAPYILHPPTYSFQALRVVDSAIELGPQYDFAFLNATDPPGPTYLGYPAIPSPDFVWQLHAATVCGFTPELALMFAWAAKDGEDGSTNWLTVHIFDPFDPVTTLENPSYPAVARQPDLLYSHASLGLLTNIWQMSVVARTPTEAVMVINSSPDESLDGMQVNVIRFGVDGSIISNQIVADAWNSQYYRTTHHAQSMGQSIVHSGDMRIDSDVSFLGTPMPNHSVGFLVSYTSPTLPVDDNNYFYVHYNVAATPSKLTFVFRDLLSDTDLKTVTSYADVDDEVAAIGQTIVNGFAGYIGQNLLSTSREASSYYDRRNIITIELGAGRPPRGTALVISEKNRFYRLPQGQVS